MSLDPSNLSKVIKTIHHNPQTHNLTLTDHAIPIPSPTQYLIRVHSVGITKGELLWPEPKSLPYPIPGFDVSGTVIKSPSVTSRFQPGAKIYALTAFDRPANARELTVIKESEMAAMPEGIGFEDAAAVPMSAETAWQALFVHGGLRGEGRSEQNSGKRILVVGASGAVGTWAVQLAKWAGVGYCAAVCGTSNVEFVKSLSANEIVDYREIGLGAWIVKGGNEIKFDLVLDCIGGESLSETWTAPKEDGLLLSIVQPPDGLKPEEGVSKGVTGRFFIVEPNGQQLQRISEMIIMGKVKPAVDSVWKFNEYEKAWGRVESGRARGKVILSVGN